MPALLEYQYLDLIQQKSENTDGYTNSQPVHT